MPVELECKIHVDDLEVIASRLRELGADEEGGYFERNWVYDRPDRSMRAEQMLLRLRDTGSGGDGLLTVKKPGNDARYKSREEVQVMVGDTETMREILSFLGYEETWYYEKYRDVWHYAGCEIVLDRLPEIGCYVEVEGGGGDEIERIILDMGLAPSNHIEKSYLELFACHCAATGRELCPMRFDRNKGQAATKEL